MSNLKAQYETAQTGLWAIKDLLDGELSDSDWTRLSAQYAKQTAKVNDLAKKFRHECSKASYGRSLEVVA